MFTTTCCKYCLMRILKVYAIILLKLNESQLRISSSTTTSNNESTIYCIRDSSPTPIENNVLLATAISLSLASSLVGQQKTSYDLIYLSTYMHVIYLHQEMFLMTKLSYVQSISVPLLPCQIRLVFLSCWWSMLLLVLMYSVLILKESLEIWFPRSWILSMSLYIIEI